MSIHTKENNEYLVKYKIGTWWTEHQTTAWNVYQEFVEASTAKEAWRKELSQYKNILRMPNKTIELISIKKI